MPSIVVPRMGASGASGGPMPRLRPAGWFFELNHKILAALAVEAVGGGCSLKNVAAGAAVELVGKFAANDCVGAVTANDAHVHQVPKGRPGHAAQVNPV